MQLSWTRLSGLVVLVVALTAALTLAPARVRDNRRDTRPMRGGVQRFEQADASHDGEDFADLQATHLPSAAGPGRSITSPVPPDGTAPAPDDAAVATRVFLANGRPAIRRRLLADVRVPVTSTTRPAAAGRAPPRA